MTLSHLKDIVRRCAVQDDNFKPEDYELFQIAGREVVEQGGSAQLLEVIKDEKNKNIVRAMGWSLLGPLVKVLIEKEEESLPHCLAIFTHILEVCSPKELLVGLLEQVEDAHPDSITDTVILLLQPLQKVLLKLGSKKASSVGMALATVLSQVARLPVPYTAAQEDEDAFGLCRCCAALLAFVEPFVQEVRLSLGKGGLQDDELRTELLKFCMKCLKEPLMEANLKEDPDSSQKFPLRRFASEILLILSSIREALPSLLFHHLLKRKEEPGFLEEDVRYPRESLACLAYLLFVEHIGSESFPAVFSPVFVLQCNMEYIDLLLSRKEESRLQKGLDLYEKSLVRLEDNSLPVMLLELKTFLSVPQNLVNVMTLCPIQNLRTRALSVFQLSIDKFDMEAKYKFFRCMLKTSSHAGVEGYVIKNIRNQIDFALKPGNGNPWFLGIHLLPLLRLALSLPQGPETDLLQGLDRIMESLNLLRYLLLRDKESENETGIWTELYRIEDSFMKPLRLGLNMSRAHYEAELKSVRESRKLRAREAKAGGPVCTVTVGGEKLPNMTPEMQLQVLQSALNTFDMIEIVLARIEEITEVKPNV
ncbi:glomulin, FKBP associated protein a isoform X2 [Scleropages formosus]|uniref:glomulin, FKBP associated protein a isoform X2 n=1 Tax=Scleropages formosus TaxID=113540 RepID=UPI000878C312|nr:glomulin isoform X2 [Scleropages formosus]